MLKKIVAIGPESTGKTMLCQQLAAHYNTLWCPEFARGYLQKHGKEYDYDDLLTIAKGQIALEEEKTIASTKDLLFIDTDMYVMKVWGEFVFDKCHNWILDRIAERKYELYFLCNIDLPWIEEEIREYPDLASREKLYHMYKDIIINQPVPWIDISGGYEERLQKAITAVQKYCRG